MNTSLHTPANESIEYSIEYNNIQFQIFYPTPYNIDEFIALVNEFDYQRSVVFNPYWGGNEFLHNINSVCLITEIPMDCGRTLEEIIKEDFYNDDFFMPIVMPVFNQKNLEMFFSLSHEEQGTLLLKAGYEYFYENINN